MEAINMFNMYTGEIRPKSYDLVMSTQWLKIHYGWQPQYDINNQYMGYKRDDGTFRDMRNRND